MQNLENTLKKDFSIKDLIDNSNVFLNIDGRLIDDVGGKTMKQIKREFNYE